MRNRSSQTVRLTRRGVLLAVTGKKIAPTIRVTAMGRRDGDGALLVELRYRTLDGKGGRQLMPRSQLLPRHRQELQARLANDGYEWPEKDAHTKKILEELNRARPLRRFRLVQAPGWYGATIVWGAKSFSRKETGKRVKLDPESSAHMAPFIQGKGDLSDWQRCVARPSRKSSPMMLAIAAAFAAPFLRLLGMNSFALNFFGRSSEGKTTLLYVSSSVAGLVDGGLPGWADSEAGLEAQCVGHRDFVMALDEGADGWHKLDASKKAHMLAFMVARNRPRTLSKEYEQKYRLGRRNYRIIVLSSSERALAQMARDAASARLQGEEVRFIDIPAATENSVGIFDGNISVKDGQTVDEVTKRLVDKIKRDCIRYQGHAMLAMLEAFVRDPKGLSTIRRYLRTFERRFKLHNPTKVTMRVRSDFAATYAGVRLAIDYGIVPWTEREAYNAISECLTRGLSCIDERKDDADDLLRELTNHLDRAKIVEVKSGAPTTRKEARERTSADGFRINGEIFVRPQWLKKHIPDRHLSAVLKKADCIRTERPDTNTVLKKIHGVPRRQRYICILADKLRETARKQ